MRTSLLKETEDAIKRTTASIPKLKPRRHKAAASNANPAAAQTTDLRDTSQVLSAFYDDEAHARAQAAAQGSWVLPAEEIASLLADLPHTAPQSSLCIDISTARPHQDLDTFLQGILSGVDDDAADAATCRGAAKQEAPPSAAATLLKQHLARLEEKGVWPLVHDDDGVLEGVHQWQGGLTTLGNGGLVHGPSTGLAPLPWAPGTTHTLEVAHAVQETAAAAPAMEWPEDIAVGEEHGGKGAEPNAALKTPMTNAASGGDGPARRAVAFPQRRRVTFEDEVQELSEENRSLGASGCDPWAELETLEAWDGAANHQDEGAVLNCQDAQIEPKSNCNVMNSGRSSHPLSQLRTVPVFHKRPAMGSPVREEGPAELQSKDVHGHGLGYDPIEDADLQGHEGNGSALRAELGPSTRSSILGDDGPSACAPRPLRTVTFGKRQAVGIAGRAAPLPLMPATSTAPANDTFLLRSQGEGPEQGAPSSFEAAATAPAADGKATSPQAAEPAPAMLGDAGGATQAAVRNAISRGGGGGRRLTLDWSKPHLDPMLLRPSVLLK